VLHGQTIGQTIDDSASVSLA